MALYKEIINDKGVLTKYHRIANIEQNFLNQEPRLTVYMKSYSDDNFRSLEKNSENNDIETAIEFEHITLPLDDSKGATRDDIYKRLKEEVEKFKDAEDLV